MSNVLDQHQGVYDKTSAPTMVRLVSGEWVDLDTLDCAELSALQWEQERRFASLLATSRRGSHERDELFRQAYDTVTTIYGRIVASGTGGVEMGYNRRYVALVERLLTRRSNAGSPPPHVFEIGYGCGSLLASLRGVRVSGIEVSQTMRDQARRKLPTECHDRLYLGNFLTQDLSAEQNCDLIFWNDVLEHLVPDEVPDFLRRAHALLAPGGYLVTITPNWHVRPSDISRDFLPPRSTAVGFHLKEYTLGEMNQLLTQAGFVGVSTPLVVTPRHMLLAGRGLIGPKRWCEPALEYLPYRLARLLCRGFGLSCTIACRP